MYFLLCLVYVILFASISFAAPIIIAVPCKNYWLVLMGVARCHGK